MPPERDKPVILVVSRDPKAAKLRKGLLEEAGFEVVAAMTIEAVTDACKKHKISLAVLGYSLPPAEKRRVVNAITEACRVPVLELHTHGPDLVESSFTHHSQTPEDFIEAVKKIFEGK